VLVSPPRLDGAEKKTIEPRRILELRGSEVGQGSLSD
jgi:hypothetical protein